MTDIALIMVRDKPSASHCEAFAGARGQQPSSARDRRSITFCRLRDPTLLWADEIVVADSGSTDRTAEIAESLGARDLLAALRHAHSPVELKNL